MAAFKEKKKKKKEKKKKKKILALFSRFIYLENTCNIYSYYCLNQMVKPIFLSQNIERN